MLVSSEPGKPELSEPIKPELSEGGNHGKVNQVTTLCPREI